MDRTPLGPPPLIYAHRGDRSRAADNTLEAYRLAVEVGADGIELDVRRTSDGVLVMSHDERVFGHPPIADLTFDELRQRTPLVPSLAETLAAVPLHIFLNVEIKNQPDEAGYDETRDIVEESLSTIDKQDDLSRILLSSFDPTSVERAESFHTDILCGQLITAHLSVEDGIRMATDLSIDALHPPMDAFLRNPNSTVQQIHDAGLAAVVWNANTPEDVQSVASAGVDIVITDDPGMARSALGLAR
jgi:glycerophosphoryl diester phosphodiesterase